MNGLRQLQSDFQDYVLGRAGAQPAIAAAVRGQSGLPADARLAIYYNAYRCRMREALSEAFDKTWSYVGDEMFAELAQDYLDAQPSHYRNLRWFGAGFADHAAQALPDYPFIAELARFEWALGLAFDAVDAAAVGLADLAQVAPEAWGELVFGLHPSVQLVSMDWNTVALWKALGEQQAPPEAAAAPQAQCWLVWRSELQPHFRSLDALEAQALEALGRGASFGGVCEAAAAADGADLTPRLAGYLRTWLAQGVLTWAPALAQA
ncbi:hypothetical protein AAKU55_005080 [Oxalobacteraceae bacterium GrIS 1.11]